MNLTRIARLAIVMIIALWSEQAVAASGACGLDELIERASQINKAYTRVDVRNVAMNDLYAAAKATGNPDGSFQRPWVRIRLKDSDESIFVEMAQYSGPGEKKIALLFRDPSNTHYAEGRVYSSARLADEIESFEILNPGYYYNHPVTNLQPVYKGVPWKKTKMPEEQLLDILSRNATPTNPNSNAPRAGKIVAATLTDNSVVIGELRATRSSKVYSIGGKDYVVSDLRSVELSSADEPVYALRVLREMLEDGKTRTAKERIVRIELNDGSIVEGKVLDIDRVVESGKEQYKVSIASKETEEIGDGLYRDIVEDRRINPKNITRITERSSNIETNTAVFNHTTSAQRKAMADFLDMKPEEFEYIHDEAFYRLTSLKRRMDGIPKDRKPGIIKAMRAAAKRAAKGCFIR